jgi:hypothetical protein
MRGCVTFVPRPREGTDYGRRTWIISPASTGPCFRRFKPRRRVSVYHWEAGAALTNMNRPFLTSLLGFLSRMAVSRSAVSSS